MDKKTNVKELLEALLKGRKNNKKYTLDMCANDINLLYLDEFMGDMVTLEKHTDYLLDICCKQFCVTREDLKSQSRSRSVLLARNMAVYILRTYKATTYDNIKNMFNRKCHSTLINGCRVIDNIVKLEDAGYLEYTIIKKKFDNYIKSQIPVNVEN